jgi:hypothetical protein
MTAARRVRHLRLHASDEALIGRGRVLVEDALRTADLREADGRRLYVVRRLELGRIDPQRAPSALATEIESRFARLRTSAVHAGGEHAATSAVVYFEDALEPSVSLIRRSVEGPAPVEWFWPLAVPGFAHGARPAAALRVALAAALSLPGGSAAATALFAEVGSTAADALCAVLRPNDGTVLTAGWAAPSLPSVDTAVSLSSGALPPVWRLLLERWALRWGPSDRRTLWIAIAALRASRPGRALDPALLRSAAVAIATSVVQHRPPATSSTLAPTPRGVRGVAPSHADAAPSAARGADASGAEPASAWATSSLQVTSARPLPHDEERAEHEAGPPSVLPPLEVDRGSTGPTPSDGGDADGDTPAARSPRARPEPTVAAARRRPDWHGALLPTAAGGLLFLVHALHRLGLPAWLAAPAVPVEAGFGARLLCDIACRTGIPADDAGVRVWSDPHQTAALAAQERPALDEWNVRLSCWLREREKLTSSRVVRRPAWLSATRTHVDVLFGVNDADVLLRALGLDVNPGWVPWLGRVVQFHYLERGRA